MEFYAEPQCVNQIKAREIWAEVGGGPAPPPPPHRKMLNGPSSKVLELGGPENPGLDPSHPDSS